MRSLQINNISRIIQVLSLIFILISTLNSSQAKTPDPSDRPIQALSTTTQATNYNFSIEMSLSQYWQISFSTNDSRISDFTAMVEISNISKNQEYYYLLAEYTLFIENGELPSFSTQENFIIYTYPFRYTNQSLRINAFGPYEFILPSDDLYWETKNNIAQNEFSKNATHYQTKVDAYFIDDSTRKPIVNQSLLWVHRRDTGLLAYANHYSFSYINNAWYNIEFRYIGNSQDANQEITNTTLPFSNLIFLNLLILVIVRIHNVNKKKREARESIGV